jgi:NAD(P)-dependent dehydrogenase (short-subunit alcohol dehydrogenase family)
MSKSYSSVKRMLWSPVDAPSLPEEASERLRGKRIAVIGGEQKVADRLVEYLNRKGAVATRYLDGHANTADAAQTFRRRVNTVDGIIDLNLEGDFSFEKPADWQSALRSSITLLQACYDDWLEEDDSQRLFYLVVTRMGGQMGYGTEPLRQPLGGIWAGLAKTLPQEIPNCNIRILDIADEDAPDLERIVVRELYRWGLFEIGYRGGVRYTLSACPQDTFPSTSLSPSDTVLLSGGARGIGYALACSLARDYGCRVVLTGREALPNACEPWIAMEVGEFQHREHQLLRAAAQSKSLAGARRQIEREKRCREAFSNLKAAETHGLSIEYRNCDVRNYAEVQSLVHEIGGGLSIVVHNAGVDSPVRLPLKSVDTFVATVAVKVEGFVNLVRAVDSTQLKMFCNVGSLTGRWGGMTGETDYAAANEALSRLGLWAARRVSFAVKTLCWPTWERLGMIKNFEIATKYMSALPVSQGVKLWRDELTTPESGEVTFIGSVGRALNPIQIKGFPPSPGLANIDVLYTQFHYLGDVLSFRPFRSIRTVFMVSPRTAPLLNDFRINGQQAIPASLLLEAMIGTGSWVQAEGWKDLVLTEIRDVCIWPSRLAVNDETCVLEHRAEGRWAGQDWQVEATTRNAATDQQVARATLIFGSRLSAAERVSMAIVRPEGSIDESGSGFEWRGLTIPRARWYNGAAGELIGIAASSRCSDLWAIPHPPLLRLPVAQLENIFRLLLAEASPARSVRAIKIDSIRVARQSLAADGVVGTVNRKDWWITDEGGQVCMRIAGLEIDATPAGSNTNECEFALSEGR